jgi:hypothetical protein
MILLLLQAMLGFAWAVLAEKLTGLTVVEQVFNPDTLGLVYFLGVVQLFAYASLVPIMSGESTDARSFGPFTANTSRTFRKLREGFFNGSTEKYAGVLYGLGVDNSEA